MDIVIIKVNQKYLQYRSPVVVLCTVCLRFEYIPVLSNRNTIHWSYGLDSNSLEMEGMATKRGAMSDNTDLLRRTATLIYES